MLKKLSSDRLARALWALVLVTLPVTSFRFMPFMGDGTYVRPLALYPLGLLWLVLLARLQQGRIRRPWPRVLTLLLAFALVALAATAFGALLAPIELRGQVYFDRILRAWVTLAIGLAFFLAAVWMNQDEDDVKFSVRWLLAGLALHLAWGAVQFVGLNTGYRKLLNPIQQAFSVRGLVKNKRISGFAYEPSWLAAQLVSLYLPWLVASLLVRYKLLESDTRRWLRFAEPVLLVAALGALLMTYSRSGLLVLVLASFFTLLLAGREPFGALWGWFRAGFRPQPGSGTWARVKALGGRVALLSAVAGMLLWVSVFLNDKGYISTFFLSQKENLADYLVDVYLGPRMAYAVAALKSFDAYPLTGVGLGASGFHIYGNLPEWVLNGVPEIARQLGPSSGLYPNPKNLYVRLLAETGLPGFVLFLGFFSGVLADVLGLLRCQARVARWLGTAGLFALAAIALQGISQDSFAAPEMWLNLGILAGAAGCYLKKESS
jgi:O-antigen ligase